MLKFMAETDGSVGTSAPVSLLDWYDLENELILVMERPVPCTDLLQYVKDNGGSMPEDKAKVSYLRILCVCVCVCVCLCVCVWLKNPVSLMGLKGGFRHFVSCSCCQL